MKLLFDAGDEWNLETKAFNFRFVNDCLSDQGPVLEVEIFDPTSLVFDLLTLGTKARLSLESQVSLPLILQSSELRSSGSTYGFTSGGFHLRFVTALQAYGDRAATTSPGKLEGVKIKGASLQKDEASYLLPRSTKKAFNRLVVDCSSLTHLYVERSDGSKAIVDTSHQDASAVQSANPSLEPNQALVLTKLVSPRADSPSSYRLFDGEDTLVQEVKLDVGFASDDQGYLPVDPERRATFLHKTSLYHQTVQIVVSGPNFVDVGDVVALAVQQMDFSKGILTDKGSLARKYLVLKTEYVHVGLGAQLNTYCKLTLFGGGL